MASSSPSLASIISSLIAAFASGRDVFRRLLEKHRSRNLRRKDYLRLKDEEKLSLHSLSHRPQDIQHAYEASNSRYGRKFRDGDGKSATSRVDRIEANAPKLYRTPR